jgi:hypothetical protein
MGGKTTSRTTLTYSEENCAHKALRLDKLPAIRDNFRQLSSGLRNEFKYLQTESHIYYKRKIKGNRERMTATAISKEGEPYAC